MKNVQNHTWENLYRKNHTSNRNIHACLGIEARTLTPMEYTKLSKFIENTENSSYL